MLFQRNFEQLTILKLLLNDCTERKYLRWGNGISALSSMQNNRKEAGC